MPHSAIDLYMEKLEKHRAMLRLMMGEAAKLPHMEEDDRSEWAHEIEEILNDGQRPAKVAPRAVLKMIGIGVRK